MEKMQKKEKSSPYPYYDLEECINFTRLVDSLGGKSVSEQNILDALNIANRLTRSYTSKVSSSKQFGLLEEKDKQFFITPLAKKILYPTSKEDNKKLYYDSFISPALYQKLVDRFAGKSLPEVNILGNILTNDFDILKTVKDKAAETFIKSGEFAGAVVEGVLVTYKDNSCTESEQVGIKNPVTNMEEKIEVASDIKYQELKLAMTEGGFAYLKIPTDIAKTDIERLKMFLDIAVIPRQ
ncbi:MAG: hypothetical protein KGZ45_07395 [Clostridium sp.]|nr:hypothetical protein [Clostridium sp.]